MPHENMSVSVDLTVEGDKHSSPASAWSHTRRTEWPGDVADPLSPTRTCLPPGRAHTDTPSPAHRTAQRKYLQCTCQWALASFRQSRRDHGGRLGVDLDRAALRVKVQRLVWTGGRVEHARVVQQVLQRVVPPRRLQLTKVRVLWVNDGAGRKQGSTTHTGTKPSLSPEPLTRIVPSFRVATPTGFMAPLPSRNPHHALHHTSEKPTCSPPASADNRSMKYLNRTDMAAPGCTHAPVEIAPALTIGLCGRLSLFNEISLNASPLGATPTCWCTCVTPMSSTATAYASGLTQDWIENAKLTSPMSNLWPSTVHTDTPNQFRSWPPPPAQTMQFSTITQHDARETAETTRT